MARGNVGETVSGMFDDLKSRLGFNRADEMVDAYDGGDDFGGYDEYGEYDEFSEYGESYRDDEPVGGFRPATANMSYGNRYAGDTISSSLVSISDVKATTPLPDMGESEPFSSPNPYAPEIRQPVGAAPASQPGDYRSFEGAPAPATPPSFDAPAYAGAPASDVSAYDPYEAYSNAEPSAHFPVRSLTIVKPTAYADVERIARAVKSGDVVVLVMRFTPDDLSKRILDFSFGVASALDANVECPGEKVFAIASGNALTPDEKRRLGAQGIL